MKVEEISDRLKLTNGAILQRHSFDCEVCTSRGEEIEPSEFMLEFEGQQAYLCRSHAQEVIDMNEDELQKGGLFKEIFEVDAEKK